MPRRAVRCVRCGQIIPAGRVKAIKEDRRIHPEKEMNCIACQKIIEEYLENLKRLRRGDIHLVKVKIS